MDESKNGQNAEKSSAFHQGRGMGCTSCISAARGAPNSIKGRCWWDGSRYWTCYISCCILFCVTDNSREMVWENGIWHRNEYGAKVCHLIPPSRKNGTYSHSSTLASYLWWPNSGCEPNKGWVLHFCSGDNDIKYKPCSGQPCTTVRPWMEDCLNQLIHTISWW